MNLATEDGEDQNLQLRISQGTQRGGESNAGVWVNSTPVPVISLTISQCCSQVEGKQHVQAWRMLVITPITQGSREQPLFGK